MTTDSAFGAFELEGWEDQATAAEYDRRLSPVTTQSTEALLDVPPDVTVHTTSPAVELLYALYFYLT